MVGAGALSRKKLRYTPSTEQSTAAAHERHSMRPKVRASSKAVAPGTMSRAMARISPTACSEATTVSETAASRP